VITGEQCRFFSSFDRDARQKYDGIIVDVPGVSLTRQAKLKERCRIFVGIDDVPSGKNIYDILIRPTFIETSVEAAEIWQGREHILLQEEYARCSSRRKPRTKVGNLLVCFGGSDPTNLTQRIASLVGMHFPDLRSTIITGPAYRHGTSLRLLQRKYPQLKFIHSSPSMAEEFMKADVAILSGGTLMFEACALGVPGIIISQNEQQNREAIKFDLDHAVINMGIGDDVTDDNLIRAISKVCANAPLRYELSAHSRKSISRRGSRRTAEKLLRKIDRADR
jgi:spore coat polysaccharide biosynthesis predicted glycosyltransferase SpsG